MKVTVNTPNHGTVNLRENPTITSKVLAQIPYGTELEATTYNGDWAKITYQNKNGYIMNKFLTSVETSNKSDLQRIYNSLSNTLKLIEEVLKK